MNKLNEIFYSVFEKSYLDRVNASNCNKMKCMICTQHRKKHFDLLSKGGTRFAIHSKIASLIY